MPSIKLRNSNIFKLVSCDKTQDNSIKINNSIKCRHCGKVFDVTNRPHKIRCDYCSVDYRYYGQNVVKEEPEEHYSEEKADRFFNTYAATIETDEAFNIETDIDELRNSILNGFADIMLNNMNISVTRNEESNKYNIDVKFRMVKPDIEFTSKVWWSDKDTEIPAEHIRELLLTSPSFGNKDTNSEE